MVAPSTISCVLSHFRMIFKELGLGELWHDRARHGNPACAFQLKQWQQGHEKISLRSGWTSTGAMELTESKAQRLLSYMAAHPQQVFVWEIPLARDGFGGLRANLDSYVPSCTSTAM